MYSVASWQTVALISYKCPAPPPLCRGIDGAAVLLSSSRNGRISVCHIRFGWRQSDSTRFCLRSLISYIAVAVSWHWEMSRMTAGTKLSSFEVNSPWRYSEIFFPPTLVALKRGCHHGVFCDTLMHLKKEEGHENWGKAGSDIQYHFWYQRGWW